MQTPKIQFPLNKPPQLEDSTDKLNDYEDDEEYEDVEGSELEDSEEEDDGSVLVERSGYFLRSDSSIQSSNADDEKLVDLLQRRLFVAGEDQDFEETPDEVEIEPNEIRLRKSSVAPRKYSAASSFDEFVIPKEKIDQDTQRLLREAFSGDQDKPLSLSPDKVAQMTNRFRIFEEKKVRRLKAKRRETETQEKLEARAPMMNTKSRQLTSQIPTFAERQAALVAKKRQQRARMDHQREQELMRDRALDLQESVKTPCICNRSNTIRPQNCAMGGEREGSSSRVAQGITSPRDGVRHTQACIRFMTMCSKMNASFSIQKKKELMSRSIDDMIAYQEGKKQRQQARAAIAKAKEAKETTFTPKINAKSEKIYAALIRSGKLDTETAGRMFKPRKASPIPPKLSFQPTISKKSKWLLKKRRQGITTGTFAGGEADANTTRPTSPLHLDVFSRLQQLSSHRETEAHREQRMREEEVLKAKAPVKWNVFQYDAASYGFILQGFDRPNLFV